ncbi:ABC-type multidrug transport system, permease component [Modestobacter italicus]|uniref:Transport permease protein n=1 Tax=Modestobacter italicus (strain DSM 44449 / CECT 9708 / BC 501) TaxID=2732864 RepID=I4F561_MODI5|nr:ABC transporter permease [Modestobacter marinus]CCH90774.1 ABC-type multidrug transport system, permease component [Modestobacter marinus]
MTARSLDLTTPEVLSRHPSPAQVLTQSATLAWRGIVKIRRNPMSLADVVIGPAIFLVLFGLVFGGAIAGDAQSYLQYVFPGILAMVTLFATMGVGVSLSSDLSAGVFDRFRSLPIARIAPLVGYIGSDVLRQVVSLTALIGVGLVLGVRLDAGVGSVLAGCALALGFALALSWAWVLLALAVEETQAVQGLAAVTIFPLAFVSNLFVPIETMPSWVQGVAAANPVSHLVDAERGLLTGGPVAEPVLDTVLWMAAVVVLLAPLSLRAYNRRA